MARKKKETPAITTEPVGAGFTPAQSPTDGNQDPLSPGEGRGEAPSRKAPKTKAPKTPKKAPKKPQKKPVKRIQPAFAKKKELAKILYTQNDLTIAAIAQRVDVTEKTLSGWIKDGDWETYKKSLITTKNEQLLFFYEQLNSLNNLIKLRPEGARFANSKEADVFSKLSATIKNLETETGVGQIIEVAKMLIDFIPENELEHKKIFTQYFDSLIKSRLKKK